ncbi:F-box domain-containing protein [Artemisia annua]|uniref:F-box domain-containing protein n=1 Tax=Artemisia annua TaxID=35608 RepID=A0A2U1M571_ARTAN|nr:F-box domain-containing protein [Artemisia annua]
MPAFSTSITDELHDASTFLISKLACSSHHIKAGSLYSNQNIAPSSSFHLFSQSKIDLPDFPYKHIPHQASTFSDLPTSPHCIISIRTPTQVLVISRGHTAWTRHKVPKTISRSWPASTTMTCAAFDQNTQTFYFLDNWKRVLKISVKDNKVCHHPVKDIVKDIHGLPY